MATLDTPGRLVRGMEMIQPTDKGISPVHVPRGVVLCGVLHMRPWCTREARETVQGVNVCKKRGQRSCNACVRHGMYGCRVHATHEQHVTLHPVQAKLRAAAPTVSDQHHVLTCHPGYKLRLLPAEVQNIRTSPSLLPLPDNPPARWRSGCSPPPRPLRIARQAARKARAAGCQRAERLKWLLVHHA